MKNMKKVVVSVLAFTLFSQSVLLSAAFAEEATEEAPAAEEVAEEVADQDKPVIGISWSYAEQDEEYTEDYDCVIEAAGGIPVHLDQIISSVCTYGEDGMLTEDMVEESGMLKTEYAEQIKACDFSQTNVAEVLEGVDGVFFVGGEDISPSLYAQPQAALNCGEEINATRDISDYTLMAYCLEMDIPLFAACRGEQMLGIVSGCQFAQDIPNYFALMGAEYPDTHRMPVGAPNRTYARHRIDVVTGTKAYDIIQSDILENVSSWHHQTVVGIKGTNLTVSATSTVNGVTTIEGLERDDQTYCVGMQFHPENDVNMAIDAGDPSSAICDYDTCLGFFKGLVEAAASKMMELEEAA